MQKIKQNSLSTNMIFQFFYQIIIFVVPLIMAPYLTRRLLENALGIHSYIHSIAYYFLILANLGIVKYGQRVISINSHNEIDLRKAFWSLYVVHAAFSIIAFVVYILYVTFFVVEYKELYYVECIYVLSALFDITWLYYGLENFRSVVIRNLAIKIVECILVFTLVKKPDDLFIYTLIMVSALLMGQFVMIPHAVMAVKPIKVGIRECIVHIKPLFVLAISVVAITLYTVFDKTLLGLLSEKDNVAFYEYSNRIINIPRTIIGIIGTIMYPRACRMASRGDITGQKKYMDYSFLFTIIIGFGSIFGLGAISHSFAVLYYGEAFSICGKVIICLSPIIIIVGLGDIIRTQYMIPNHMDKKYTICIMLNALINIILTIILIPYLGIYGAVIGTVSAELFGLIYQSYLCRKIIDFKFVLRTSFYFVINGLMMYSIIVVASRFISNNYIGLIIKILLGITVYGIGCMFYLYKYQNVIFLRIKHRIWKCK